MTAVSGLGRIWTLWQTKFVQKTWGAAFKILNLLRFAGCFLDCPFLTLGWTFLFERLMLQVWEKGDVQLLHCPFINTENSSKFFYQLFLAPVLSNFEEINEIHCKITAVTRYVEVGLKDKNWLFCLMPLGENAIVD